ncbi:UNVERIFIED_CONTAM: hypothetical protein Scaly_3139000 [Sesamum calycinum]|uniref:Reverse transcriptase Ty1/copia-type domain-containing protein n=1 Tax=Sesamum calycinum TaxID=2727403 RepID=A0AAW2JH48_9LAMI
MGKGKKRTGTQQQSRANDFCAYCREKGQWKRDCPNLSSDQGMFVVEVNMVTNSASWVLDKGCGAHICNELQVLQSCRKLSKDEVVLRLGDGKAVTTEAVVIINLVVSDHMKDGSSHLLGHISQDRMKRLVDSKSLEIDNLDNLPACEPCLKGKMTKKPFVGQGKLANGLSDLIHRDIRGPLNTQARSGFSYFITFIDDHSRHGYVYLMWYKSELLKTVYGVAERRNRILLDMIRSMMSFTELPLSFWGYALETAARFLNIAPSKTVTQAPYQIWHGKPASYNYLRVWGSPAYVKRLVGDKLDSRSSLCRFIVFLKRGFPTDTRCDELLLEESSEAPQSNAGTSYAPNVFTDNVPILCREAMSDIDSRKWLEATKSKMDSMSSNQVWTLVDRPKGVRPVGCKWVYKRKIGANGEVTTFKARLVAKGYT